jgi:hypothetical protein
MSGRKLQVTKSVRSPNSDGTIELQTDLLTRSAAAQPYESALNEVQVQLAIAKAIFDHQGDGGRLGAYNALLHAIDFFAGQGFPHAILKPLAGVAEAMIDVDRGASNPLLQQGRRAKTGAPPASIGQLVIEGQLAVITQCCVLHFKKEGKYPYVGPATVEAAKLVKKSNWPINPTPTNMREIRERVNRSVGSQSYDRIVFDILMNAENAKRAPLDFAKRLLGSQLSERVPEKFSP